MKRNDMIKKMVHDTFAELQGENMQTAEFPYRVAELMLAVCEEAGMLPPASCYPTSNFNGVTNVMLDKDGKYTGAVKLNEWEQEEPPLPIKRKIQLIVSESNLTVVKDLTLTDEQINKLNSFIENELEDVDIPRSGAI